MRFVFALPVWLMLADMVCTFVLNVLQFFTAGREAAKPADGLPVSPETAFNGLQVLANGGMVLVIGFGLLVLLRLNLPVPCGESVPLGVSSVLRVLAGLALSLVFGWSVS